MRDALNERECLPRARSAGVCNVRSVSMKDALEIVGLGYAALLALAVIL